MEGINEYILDRPISDLSDESLREFWDFDYDMFARDYGIVRNFPGEIFYAARNNKFLDRECIHTIIAALNGRIYKVLFRFITPSTPEYEDFKKDAYEYLVSKYGEPSEVSDISDHRIAIWDGSFGNVIIDADILGTSIIFTSSVLRPARKKSLLQRLLGS